jgi:hypothetical protein
MHRPIDGKVELEEYESLTVKVGKLSLQVSSDSDGDVHLYFEAIRRNSVEVGILPKSSNHVVLRPAERKE